MDEKSANSRAWDWEAENGNAWARIVGEDEIEKAKAGNPGLRVTVERNVPDSWVEGNCGPEELGMDPGKRWKLNGIRLCGERGWGFRLVDKNGSSCMVRTEVLDKLFAPVLPLVQVELMDYL